MTFSLPVDQIDAARLDALKADDVREGRQLDYKEMLPGNCDDDKREFLGDVTAFANTTGGDLIYGVIERRDETNTPTGQIEQIVGLPSLNLDAERLRLENVLRNGTSPRIPNVEIREISRDPGSPCLLIRVPRSLTGPHMVTYKGLSRFYSRNSAGKYQLDVQEIRAAFVAAETAYERLRSLRIDRVARVGALETPAPVGAGPKLLFHALPVAGADEVWGRFLKLNNAGQDNKILNLLPLIQGSVQTWRFNLDGFVLHTLRGDIDKQSYTQLFRDGGVECFSWLAKDNERGGFYFSGWEQRIIARFDAHKEFWRLVGVTAPVVLGLTLFGVRGWRVLPGPYGMAEMEGALDEDVVVVPDVLLSDLETPSDVALKPLFDLIWNGGGWPESPNYRDGRRTKPK